MRIIINEGRKVAVPTTRFESDALYYLKSVGYEGQVS